MDPAVRTDPGPGVDHDAAVVGDGQARTEHVRGDGQPVRTEGAAAGSGPASVGPGAAGPGWASRYSTRRSRRRSRPRAVGTAGRTTSVRGRWPAGQRPRVSVVPTGLDHRGPRAASSGRPLLCADCSVADCSDPGCSASTGAWLGDRLSSAGWAASSASSPTRTQVAGLVSQSGNALPVTRKAISPVRTSGRSCLRHCRTIQSSQRASPAAPTIPTLTRCREWHSPTAASPRPAPPAGPRCPARCRTGVVARSAEGQPEHGIPVRRRGTPSDEPARWTKIGKLGTRTTTNATSTVPATLADLEIRPREQRQHQPDAQSDGQGEAALRDPLEHCGQAAEREDQQARPAAQRVPQGQHQGEARGQGEEGAVEQRVAQRGLDAVDRPVLVDVVEAGLTG